MPLTNDAAEAAINPEIQGPAREAAIAAAQASVAAQEAYWSSRPELEQLKAQAEGHIGVVAHDDPVLHETVDGTTAPDAVEAPAPAAGELAPVPDPPAADGLSNEDKLRAQIRGLGGEPEA